MNLYEQIRRRTGGNIYIGVTGPVRTGKSTLVKRLMEELVIPNIEDEYRRERAKDELPQSGSGKTIMTAEPKFVPEQAVQIRPDEHTLLSVRLIDSVGYMIPGALGATEDGKERLVTTPWFEHEIPLSEAAELGTQKVMADHCTVGLVVTTDGSVTDIPREDYQAAEQRAISDMQKTGKPFLVLLNSAAPDAPETVKLADEIGAACGAHCVPISAAALDRAGITRLLQMLLGEFGCCVLRFRFPGWFDALSPSHPLRQRLYAAVRAASEQTRRICDAQALAAALGAEEAVQDCRVEQIDLGAGTVSFSVRMPDSLFYRILSERSGVPMDSDAALLRSLGDYRRLRSAYERLSDALEQVERSGYGLVLPQREELALQRPELLKKGGAWGVRIQASAPAIHLLSTQVSAELSPMVGDEAQSRELVERLRADYEADRDALWDSRLFGKTIYELVSESLTGKLERMGGDTRLKFRNALGRIVNEGANGLICLIL